MEQQPSPGISKARHLATRLAKIQHDFLAGHSEPSKVAEQLRALAQWIEGDKPPPPKGSAASTKEEKELFAYWCRAVGKDVKKTKFTPERRAKVRSRLREGYTPAEIKRAIDNVAESPFHRGDNETGREYTRLEMILASGSKLEQYRDMKDDGARAPVSGEGELAELKQQAAEALRKGEIDAYNRIQERIESRTTG